MIFISCLYSTYFLLPFFYLAFYSFLSFLRCILLAFLHQITFITRLILMGCVQATDYQLQKDKYSGAELSIEQSARFVSQKNIVAVNDQKKRHNLTNSQILQLYQRSKGSIEKFFSLLSERVTQFYDDLSSEILQSLNNHKVTYNETKILLSQQVLVMALDVLEVLGKRVQFSYNIQTFHHFNKAQSNLLAYLKMKYPRAGNVFVSNDLASKFKSFDFVENPNNDILTKFQIYFIQNSEAKIIKQVKIFFNSLMEELDQKFPSFKTMMEEKVFKYEEGQGAQKKRKILNYKIGRKISENAPKFVIDDSQQLTINSPEIFRTFVKWVEDLQDWFKSTQEEINSRQYFKTYKTKKTGNIYSVIPKDQIDELHSALKKKLKQQIGTYNQKLKDLRRQMDIFNINLLKILYTIERKQKYVPLRQAKIIKYAMLNTKMVSWMLGQMLIFLLKILTEVGQELENTKIRRKLDLIKFTVTDLMRAQVVGNKKQILAVYMNIEELQKNNQINIIKIKNRLGTSLNDAMIIFTTKNSKLICELQLILSEGGSEIEKLKNIQFLNHVLYELERSPYGVLSEIAVILGYKDNKINFENKIRFQKNQSADFEVCKKNHKVQTWSIQKKPFICHQCTQFYLPLQNIFDYSYCQSCYTFQCCKCAFALDQELQRQEIHSRFVGALQSSLFTVKLRPKIPKDITIDKVLKRFFPDPFFFKNIFPRKAYSQIKPKDLINFIKNKVYVQTVKNEELDKLEHIYFLMVQFRGAETNLKMYYWNQSQGQIQNCYDSKQTFADLSKISTSYYDFIVFAKTNDIQKQQISAASKYIRLCFKPEQHIQNIKTFRFLNLSKKHSVMLVLKVQVSKLSNNVDGLEVSEKALALKKDFVYDSLEDVRRNLPDIQSVRQNFHMKNIGVTSTHLDYLKTSPQKTIIKSINLCDNKLVNIDVILEQCVNLKELIVPKNFIKDIKIKKKLPKLQKFLAYENLITLVEGLQMAQQILSINFERNKLKNIKPAQLKKLKQFNISNNKLNSLKWIEDSNFPELEILIMNNSGISYFGAQSKLDFVLNFPQLKQLNFSENMANRLKINANQLAFLDCSNCSLRHVQFNPKKIQYLNLSSNQIENLPDILKVRMTEVKKIDLNKAGVIQILPELDNPELQFIDLSNCELTNVTNLSKSNLLRIQTLILDGNQNVKSLPPLKFLTLKTLSIKDVNLNNLQFTEQSTLPLIEQLEITGEAVSDTKNSHLLCPSFKFNKLKRLKLKSLSFQSMSSFSNSELPQLQQIIFEDFNSLNFPTITLDSLKTMSFKNCSIQNVEGIHKSMFKNLQIINIENFNETPQQENQNEQAIYKQEKKLQRINSQKLTKIEIKSSPCVYLESLFKYKPALQYFNATDNKMKQFPIIELKNARTLDFSDCQIENIRNLSQCKFENLEKLNLENNLIQSVPQLKMPNLRNLTLQNNKISDIKEFQNSSLPKLESIDFDQNCLKVFPSINFPSLKEMQIGKNPIISLQGLGRCDLKSLQKFILADCKQLIDLSLPVINFPNCKEIKIIDCNIQSLDNLQFSTLPQIHSITLINLPLIRLPKLKLPALKTIKVKMEQLKPKRDQKSNQNPEQKKLSDIFGKKQYNLEDVSNLSHWRCPKLTHISINNTDASKLPCMSIQTLQVLDFQGCNITDISEFEKSDLPSLSQINLSSNKSLEVLYFPNSADQIIFTNCNFKTINSQSLRDARCKNIQLGQNKIEEICEVNTSELEFLNLQENLLTDIFSVFKESPLKLKNLNLKNNNIKAIPEFTFPELNYLNLSVNKISSLRIKKKNFPCLNGLYAYENELTYIAGLDIPTLNSINFCKNQLQDVSFFVQQYKETEEIKISNLKLQGNKIKSVKFLPYVSNIYLSNNELQNLDWLNKCQTDFIAILNVSGNKINNVKGLESEENNNARFNVLSQLNLSENNLKQFEFKDARFPCLDNLNLSKNQLQKFPNISQSTFPNLMKLNLSNNIIASLPIFCKLNKLKHLNVANNKISTLESKDLIFKDLKQLILQGNMIKDLKGIEAIKSNKLESLNVSLNTLTKLPKISHFVTLKQLKADKNQIQSFDQFLLSNINDWANLKFIYLIKQSLADKLKQEIRKKIRSRVGKSECRNSELVAETKTKISKVSVQKQSARN